MEIKTETDLNDDFFEYIPTGTFPSKEKFEKELKRIGLGEYLSFISGFLRDQILIETSPADEREFSIGQSKIGGLPDLPESLKWPIENNGKSLAFIAQINLIETKHYDKSDLLPDKGILYFFYSADQEAWGFDPKDKDKFKVLYYEGDINHLQRLEFPKDLQDNSKYNSCKLEFKSSYSLPGWENEIIRQKFDSDELDLYISISSVEDMTNKLLGHSDNIQAPMELECQLVTNGLYCGDSSGYDDPKSKELEKGMDDWRLLFQIDSEDDKTGMMWGDVGRLYFWIKESDLRNKNFDNSWFILQCS